MENISLRVNIEGKEEKVATDWFAIMATLKNVVWIMIHYNVFMQNSVQG